ALGRRAAEANPATHEHLRPQVMPLSRSIFFVTWSLVTKVNYAIHATVLLFGSLFFANVAMLIFARTVMREGEIVVRSALGATRGRVVTQLFVEALVLAGVAAVAGLIAATVAMRYAMWVVEDALQGLPFWMKASISPRTLVYAALLTIFGALIAGVLPAMKVTRGGVQATLRDAAGGVSRVHFGGIWTAVIVIQLAVTVAFPVIIFFELRDAAQLRAFDPGFATGQYLGVRIAGESAEAGEQDRVSLAKSAVELERRLEGDPGVAAVAFADTRPLSNHSQLRIEVEGAEPAGRRRVSSVRVSPDFFETLVAAPVAGRLLHSGDLEEEARSVVVNESFARDVLGGTSPIGRRVRYTDPADSRGSGESEPGPWHLIVGLVPDLGMTFGGTPGVGAGIYHAMKPGDADPLTMLIRVQGDPSNYADRLRVLTTAVDPTLRIEELLPMDAAHEEELEEISNWVRIWLGVNAIVLGLSLAGIYAAMSFAVSRRTREIGIRVALGASAARIAAAVFRKPALQVAGGIALGSVLATVLSWAVLGENIWRVATPWILGHIVMMTAICMTACIIPARRAWRIAPTEALREG
ncbi:MAG TPA: FtsX-like permease family protein, partial [Thermoanaerobaculia bacterium]|nr:FtsX-like permease family protein [Thermoanaerobaculia bacterium]